MKSLKMDPILKRKYNACYRARKKGYRIDRNARTIYRGETIDYKLEDILSEYGYHVQLKIF